MIKEAISPEEVHILLLAALSAAGAAVTGMAEFLRTAENVEGVVSWVRAYEANPEKELLPLGEDIIEPLLDALGLAICAGGLVKPLQRIAMDIERFQQGDDD